MTKENKQIFTRRITQANRTQLVVIVYEMLLVYLEDAVKAYEAEDKQEFVRNLKLARECIGQMRTSLNFQYELSKNLFAIYCFAAAYGQYSGCLCRSYLRKDRRKRESCQL